ncbi:hypothetical protein ABZ807_06580 [Micromonospora sp. NPDC047548]
MWFILACARRPPGPSRWSPRSGLRVVAAREASTAEGERGIIVDLGATRV